MDAALNKNLLATATTDITVNSNVIASLFTLVGVVVCLFVYLSGA